MENIVDLILLILALCYKIHYTRWNRMENDALFKVDLKDFYSLYSTMNSIDKNHLNFFMIAPAKREWFSAFSNWQNEIPN